MKTVTRTLIDSSKSFAPEEETIRGEVGDVNWRITLRTLRGGRSEGVRVVEIDNGSITVDVLPTRGMGIWRVRRGETTLGWKSPTGGPVHPAYVPIFDPSGLGFLDGFHELLCRCGLEWNGAPDFDANGRLVRPLHGRVANLPVHRLDFIADEHAGTLTLRGMLQETRFLFQSLALVTSVTVPLRGAEFSWHDEVVNLGARPATMQMLYHFNVGEPLLVPGARVHAPVKELAPIALFEGKVAPWDQMPAPQAGSGEQVYCFELLGDEGGETRVLLGDLAEGDALAFRFNNKELPRFVLWKNFVASEDGYVMGIEPSTNYPNRHTFEKEQGRVVSLAPGDRWQANVLVKWLSDPGAIKQEIEAIEALQRTEEAVVHHRPRSGWSPNP